MIFFLNKSPLIRLLHMLSEPEAHYWLLSLKQTNNCPVTWRDAFPWSTARVTTDSGSPHSVYAPFTSEISAVGEVDEHRLSFDLLSGLSVHANPLQRSSTRTELDEREGLSRTRLR